MTSLEQLLIEELPGIVKAIKGKFAAANPGAPEPTDEEMVLAYNNAYKASVNKDDAWLAAHPE